MVNESAIYASASGFFGAVTAVPAVQADQRGAAVQAHGCSSQHACRTHGRVRMGSNGREIASFAIQP